MATKPKHERAAPLPQEQRGVPIELFGAEYRLRFSMYAAREMERALGLKGLKQVVEYIDGALSMREGDMDVQGFLNVVWGFLRHSRPETTTDELSREIDFADLERVQAALSKAIEEAFPKVAAKVRAAAEQGPEDPLATA